MREGRIRYGRGRFGKAAPDWMDANSRPDRPDEDSEQHRVCYCMHVHEGTLRAAIRAGAHDLGALMDATRAGREGPYAGRVG